MSPRTEKWIFWISTGLISAMMLGSAGMYLFNTEEVSAEFSRLGYPTTVVIPLAIAKILAVLAIISNQSAWLKEWAYAGLFFDFLLATQAHGLAGDGWFGPSVVATILLLTSYYFDNKVRGNALSS
ncbi:MAG: DoxX family protein [Bacteroidota bacterium]